VSRDLGRVVCARLLPRFDHRKNHHVVRFEREWRCGRRRQRRRRREFVEQFKFDKLVQFIQFGRQRRRGWIGR
jgi:hypothetical protein